MNIIGVLKNFRQFIMVKTSKFWKGKYQLLRRKNGVYFRHMIQYKAGSLVALTASDKENINHIWGKYKRYYNPHFFEFYKSFDPDRVQYYFPDDFWYLYVDLFLTKSWLTQAIDDKNMYDMYFYDVKRPKTIIRKIDGAYLDAEYETMTEEDALQVCAQAGDVIIKPAVESQGGYGIHFWNSGQGILELKKSLEGVNIIVQQVVKQHDLLNRLHEESINTVRIMVMLGENDVEVLSSVVRMGIGQAKVDNASSGGIVCGINPDGSLKECAYDAQGNKYDRHPQGAIFSECKIPNMDKCISFVKRLAPRFSYCSKLQSWDVAVGVDGNPILIEVNLTYGELDFHQMCNGPILGTKTCEFLQYIAQKNKLLKSV